MRRTKRIGLGLLALTAMLTIMLAATGCGPRELLREVRGDGNCGGTLEWADFLMLNDIMYTSNHEGTKVVSSERQGERIGEVSYTLNEHACADHTMKNGDASYLPIGTPIHAMEGYKSSYRIIADGKVYEADRNPHAKTLGDLWDIEGKIAKVSLDSGMDGSRIGDFSPEASAVFARELLPLELVGFDRIYKDNKPEYGIFLRVYLKDGTSFRMVFYEKANAFTAGAYGTEELRTVIVSERARIKKAAGM